MHDAEVLHIDDSNFEELVLESKVPFVLDVGATWCGPCKALAPVVEKLAQQSKGRFRVGVIDVDDAPRAAERLRVRNVPTVIAFAPGGVEHARHTGTTSLERLMALVPGGA
jgi:thioredoxin 1